MKKNKNSKEDSLDKWVILGRFFGYPECCINAFKNFEHIGGDSRKLDGTGYIPCATCNKKSTKFLIDVINKKRISRLPFPEENSLSNDLHEIMVSSEFTMEEKEFIIDLY